MLATICLNEAEWLEKNYLQHRDWPGLCKHVFVEAADKTYKDANPEAVNINGLSTDGTTLLLHEICGNDERTLYVPFGVSSHPDPAQGKVPARNAYMDVAEYERPNWVICIDADEFYTRDDQRRINDLLSSLSEDVLAARFNTREIWRPESIKDEPLFKWEATGGRFFGMEHVRFWRWQAGLRYVDNHNWLSDGRGHRNRSARRFGGNGDPQCVHMGWTSSRKSRRAKNAYYAARGEGLGDGRDLYIKSRAAWETWQPGDALPDGARVVPYDGFVPEVFR